MPLPLIPIAYALMASGAVAGAGANIYSQAKQRDLYRYQRGGYERQLQDWHKNVSGRSIRYPETSYEGHIRALNTGISQSYASTLGSIGRSLGFAGGSALAYQHGVSRNRSRGLYSLSVTPTSRWF